MKKMLICLLLLMCCCGCVYQGAAVQPLAALKVQGQNALDTIVYNQAHKAMTNVQKQDYSIKVEQTSGSVLTLLVTDGKVEKLIVHGKGHTQWIQMFDDRILCLTGDDGHVEAQLLDHLNAYGDMETIIQCALDPVSLVQGRSFQRTSGAEAGSVQIATDNIDFWMKVSAENELTQVKLYLSHVPMMTLYYSKDVPLFPSVQKTDYPMYSDLMSVNHDILTDHGFIGEDASYIRETGAATETLSFDSLRLDYTITDENHSIHLVYDNLTLKGMHTAIDEPAYCEVNLTAKTSELNELTCGEKELKEMQDLFEALMNEFK